MVWENPQAYISEVGGYNKTINKGGENNILTNPTGCVRVVSMKTTTFLVCLMFAWFAFSINQGNVGEVKGLTMFMPINDTIEEINEFAKTLKLN